jgi:hypothetical protein
MRRLTDNRVLQKIGWAAGACWCAAWFLPVVEGYSGWSAFLAALEGPFRRNFPVRGDDAVPQLMSALTNVVFVLQFVNWNRGLVRHWTLYLKITIACLLINLYWLVQMLRAGQHDLLLAGYYVWLSAFALLVVLGILNVVSARRTSKTPTGGMQA